MRIIMWEVNYILFNRTTNYSSVESSSGQPWVCIHAADLLSHAPIWTYDDAARRREPGMYNRGFSTIEAI